MIEHACPAGQEVFIHPWFGDAARQLRRPRRPLLIDSVVINDVLQDTTQLVSSEVLATVYAGLAVVAALSRFGPWHPKTKMINGLCVLLVIGSVSRILYFA